MSEFLEDALGYLARRWSIIPIRHRGEHGKQPALREWTTCQIRLPNEAEIRGWFEPDGLDGIAVICGAVSGGLVCRDFDQPGAYEAWAGAHADLAGTLPTAKTGRGYHVYGRSTSQVRTRKLRDGELRGEGAYCIVPPSRHPNGCRYAWIIAPTVGAVPVVEVAALAAVDEVAREAESQRGGGHPLLLGGSAAPLLCCSDAPVLSGSAAPVLSGSAAPVLRGSAALPLRLSGNPAVENAINATLPTRPGQRNNQVFALARALKALPELACADPLDLEPVVRLWHARALPVIATKAFDVTLGDFVHAWSRVRYAAGESPLMQALERSRQRPPPAVLRFSEPATRALVGLAAELQASAGAAPFFLSHRVAGELLGICHTSAGALLAVLCARGILRVVKRGTHRRATRYHYVAHEGTETPPPAAPDDSPPPVQAATGRADAPLPPPGEFGRF